MLHKNHLQRRVVAWLATAALLMHALAPGLSYALAYAPVNSGWMEICTSSGSKWISRDASPSIDSSTSQTGAGSSSQHCPYCSQASHAPVVPTSSLSWLPPAPRSFVVSFIDQPSPASVSGLSARARAPPLPS